MRANARTGQSRQHRARTISTSIPAQLTVSSYADMAALTAHSSATVGPLVRVGRAGVQHGVVAFARQGAEMGTGRGVYPGAATDRVEALRVLGLRLGTGAASRRVH